MQRHLLALAVGAISISFAAIFFRLAAPADPLVAPSVRLLFAATMLSPLIIWKIAKGEVSREVIHTGLLGGVLYALHFGLWVSSLFFTTVAASVTLVTATPLMLGLYGVVTKRDEPSRALWQAIAVSVFGIVLVTGSDFAVTIRAGLGDLMALGGAVAIAAYFVRTRKLERVNVFVLTGISSLVGGVLLFTFALAIGRDLTLTHSSIGWLFLAALIPQLIGHSCLFWALRAATPTQVGLATVAEPVFATLIGWFVLSERPSLLTTIGCLIVLSGLFIAMRKPTHPKTVLREPADPK